LALVPPCPCALSTPLPARLSPDGEALVHGERSSGAATFLRWLAAERH
jgi:hypothetical protein